MVFILFEIITNKMSMLLFSLVCIPARYMIDTFLIANGFPYALAAMAAGFVARFVYSMFESHPKDTCVVWSRLAVAAYYVVIAYLTFTKKTSEAITITQVTLLTSLLRHFEIREINMC
jgi:hypothetical protein